jgi:hypothetical protein
LKVSELAYNKDGERFEPHDAAAFWRARRCRERGLEVVYKRGRCTPLTLPINATEAEFAGEVAYAAGKYRLDQLDESMQPIGDAPPAYVYVHPQEGEPAVVEDAGAVAATRLPMSWRSGAPLSTVEQLLAQVVDANTKMATAVIERFGGYMDSSAHLVRAADGAGMPARAPMELRNAEVPAAVPSAETDEDADDDHATWPDIIQSCLPYLDTAFAAFIGPKLRNSKRPRNANVQPTAGERPVESMTAAAASSEQADEAPMPEITPAMRAHFMSIYTRLSPDEASIAREVAGEMTEAELGEWMVDLSSLSVDDATAKVKSRLVELMPKTSAGEGES